MDEIVIAKSFLLEPKVGQKLTDLEAMQLAIAEAKKGSAYVSPNPQVGCVVLDKQGQFLSKGYHKKYGGPHAEVNALELLSEAQLKDAQMFVTLEPCAHEGKTPSCAKMIAKKPIAKVVYGLVDPNPLVSGQGAQILKDAGKMVEVFPHLQEELEEVCEIFLWNFRAQKVFVSLKLASSLDGVVALEGGESRWITNEQSRQYAHFLRASHDAILVGGGTVRQDNPRLNIRHPEIIKENKVVVLDTDGEVLKKYFELEISKSHSPENVYWCVAEDAPGLDQLPKSGPQILKVKRGLRNLNMTSVLEALWTVQIRSVIVEGGSKVASSIIENKLANRLFLFQAPIILGQKNSFSWTANLKTESMASRIELKNVKFYPLGNNILTTGLF